MAKETNIPSTDEPRKQSLGAKWLIASAFSTIGAKIGLPALVLDVNNLVGPKLTLGEKFRGVFNKSFVTKFEEKTNQLIQQGKSPIVAGLSVMKYSLIIGTIGSIAGFVVGWMRGGLFEDWKDVAKHPLKATAVVFGFKSAEQFLKEIGKDTEVKVTSPSEHSTPASAPSDKWQEHVKSRASFSESVAQEKAQQSSAASLG